MEVAKLLIEHGADVSARHFDGDATLQIAKHLDSEEIVTLLRQFTK